MVWTSNALEPWSQIGSAKSGLDEARGLVHGLEDLVVESGAPDGWGKLGQVHRKVMRIRQRHVDLGDLESKIVEDKGKCKTCTESLNEAFSRFGEYKFLYSSV